MLITLAVIGVVAAMTIPTLISYQQTKVLDTQKKKATAELTQAFKMMLANENEDSLVRLPITKCGEDKECIKTEIAQVLKGSEYVSANPEGDKYKFADKEETVWDGYNIKYVLSSLNGSLYGIVAPEDEADSISVIADVNGSRKPNQGGVDLCLFNISERGIASMNCNALENAEVRIAACKPGNTTGCADYDTCRDNGGIWVDSRYISPNWGACYNNETDARKGCKEHGEYNQFFDSPSSSRTGAYACGNMPN